MLGDNLNAFHASLSKNESFKGSKGTLFLGEFNILVRNLIQSSKDVLSASENDKKEHAALQAYREPVIPVEVPPAYGGTQEFDPYARFYWTASDLRPQAP
jgi:hypothetical protein